MGLFSLMGGHPALVPLFAIVGTGAVGSLIYLARLGTHSEVIWNKARDPFPWRRVEQDNNIKFMSVAQKFEKKPNDPRTLFSK